MDKPETPKDSIWISLPIPSEIVLLAYIEKSENPDVVVDRYLNLIESTAKLESETIVKSAKQKFNFYWKLIAILAAFTFLMVGITIGTKIKVSWDKKAIECTPTTQSTRIPGK